MASMGGVRLAELLGGLSLFADVADGFPREKVLRTTIISVEIARREGLPEAVQRDVFYTSLLRYAGCVGFAHEEAHHYGAGNDIATRRVMAMADPTEPASTVFAIAGGVGAGAFVLARARAVLRLLSDTRAVERHARAQCETSLWAARAVGMSPAVQEALGAICERWDGLGAPNRLAGEALALPMRVHQVGDIGEIALHRGGVDAARELVRRRAGKQLDPRFAARFADDLEELAALVDGPSVWDRYLAAEPGVAVVADGPRIDDLARTFAALADLKSAWLGGHSLSVAELAHAAGVRAGLAAAELDDLRRAGWLHDVGRAGVPNAVWDKPGPLAPAERREAEMHAFYTDQILASTSGLRGLARIAGAAHERCDGSGYYRAIPGGMLPLAARILAAADAFVAMQEPRPHRSAMSRDQAAAAIRAEVAGRRLCPTAVDAVLAGGGRAPRRAPRGLTDREVEVLVLLARGKSNREIGALLGISPRTAQNHVAHVYDKIGVYSRAGAALFAVENGLVGPGT